MLGHRVAGGHLEPGATLGAQRRQPGVDSLRNIYDSEEFFEGREDNINYYSFLSGEEYRILCEVIPADLETPEDATVTFAALKPIGDAKTHSNRLVA